MTNGSGGALRMIIGLGLDVCEVSRMENNLLNDRFLSRYFTEAETAYVRSRGSSAAQTLSGLFASKEALGKAIGGGIDFEMKEAEILHDENGRPYYHLTGSLADRTSGSCFLLSITHDGGISAAVCIRIIE